MRRFLDMWARIYRNTRALSAAVMIWAAVFIMWGFKCQADRDPVVDRVLERGQVMEVLGNPDTAGSNDFKMRPVRIMLADSTEIQLVVPTPLPRVGDRVPLRVEVFRSGKRGYTFDTQEWLLNGPG